MPLNIKFDLWWVERLILDGYFLANVSAAELTRITLCKTCKGIKKSQENNCTASVLEPGFICSSTWTVKKLKKKRKSEKNHVIDALVCRVQIWQRKDISGAPSKRIWVCKKLWRKKTLLRAVFIFFCRELVNVHSSWNFASTSFWFLTIFLNLLLTRCRWTYARMWITVRQPPF